MSARRYNHVSRRTRVCLAGLVALCCVVFGGLVPARAAASTGPQWTVTAVAAPTNFAPGDQTGNDNYTVIVRNTGDAPSDGSTVTITDTLPAGLTLAAAGAVGSDLISGGPLTCTGLTCTFAGVVPADDALTLTVPVDVGVSASSGVPDLVGVSGGGAAGVSASAPTTISSASPGYGIAAGSFSTVLSSTQAGAHADMTTSFFFNTDATNSTFENLKDTIVDLPVGFAGDPNAAPTCSAAQLANMINGGGITVGGGAGCPVDSQVGVISLRIDYPIDPFVTASVYNMEPLPGDVARLGFNAAIITTNIAVKVRPGDYGLTATTPDIWSGTIPIDSVSLTIWGVPADPSHDLWRGISCGVFNNPCTGPGPSGPPPGASASIPPAPFLSNPTSCTAAPLSAGMSVTSWQQRDVLRSTAPALLGPMVGCDRLRFDPLFTAVPTTNSASAPSGLNVDIGIPQTYGNPDALASAHLKDAVVKLPVGMTVNPSAGAGLGACTPGEYAAETATSLPGAGCPNSSELGTVSIDTPVLKEPATGFVYLAQPHNNPFDSLLAIYVVARIPDRGIIVRVAGQLVPDPVTGQLTTIFDGNPQLPFSDFKLSFRQGQTSPLVTPPACGTFTATAELTPWSGGVVSSLSTLFDIGQGVGGGACPAGGVPPFSPQVTAGTLNNNANAYSPFDLRISRGDGEQEITRFSTDFPPGLVGSLTGIPFCSDAAIDAARGNTGAAETASPSCPAASEIGHTLVGAGVGGVLAYTPGKVYLAGPYHGSALSIVSITSATVGPFDLGTVVIRFALRIDPVTAQVHIDATGSDPIPHILQGIVIHVRDIRVYIDRQNFIFNPTSCAPNAITNTVTGDGADPANPGDDVAVPVVSRFQAANCSRLPFSPKFSASTSAHASRANGTSLEAKIVIGVVGEANVRSVKVDLPKQLPSRLTTLQKACLDKVFNVNPAACPPQSLVGSATAVTPILPVPLTGPAYFVSHGSAGFPDLVIVLQGYGITIDLAGATNISSKGITSSTFRTVPDVPVTSFDLKLPAGPHSALTTNGSLCKTPLIMPTQLNAQNGAQIKQSTRVKVTGCPKAKKAKKTKHKQKHKAKKKAKKGR
jgi:uncharacterized repeat protein (TIGR01451 family)